MVGFYILYLVVFIYMYGGTKYAYYRKGQLILSQTLGTVIANAVMYIQIVMVVGQFPFPAVWPMLVICVPDFIIIAVINQISDGIFRKMFPPKHLLLICDLEYKDHLLRKLSSRKDLYEVTRCVVRFRTAGGTSEGSGSCDSMMLYGIEEQKRNDLIKFCYEKSILDLCGSGGVRYSAAWCRPCPFL